MIDLSNRLEPHLGEIGSICTKTGVNDEDRTTDDLISRKMAIEALADGLKGIFVEYRDIAEKMIGKLPSAQQQCKTGKWEVFCPNLKYKYHCSECGAYHSAMYDFCPTCGADMRGKQDEVD